MAIHPLDITPENEAAAAAEHAEQRRANSMGGMMWLALIIGIAGLVIAFIAACLLSQGPGQNEILGQSLHNFGKFCLLVSLLFALMGVSFKSRPAAERVIEAESFDDVASLIRSLPPPPRNGPAPNVPPEIASAWRRATGVGGPELPIARPKLSGASLHLPPPPSSPVSAPFQSLKRPAPAPHREEPGQ